MNQKDKPLLFIVRKYPQVADLACVDLVRIEAEDGTVTDGYVNIKSAVDTLKKLEEMYPAHNFEIVSYVTLPIYERDDEFPF